MRSVRSVVRALLVGVLMLTGASCATESVSPPAPTPKRGAPDILSSDCLDLKHGAQHLALHVVGDLHALDPDAAALNADFPAAGGDITVQQLAWVLLGAKLEKDADGVVFVWATDRTDEFPAVESLRRTIFESAGSDASVKHLDLGRTKVAGLPAETAEVTNRRGDYNAWTFTSGQTRFIVFAHQQGDTGAFNLANRVPDLLTTGGCPGA